ncbi:hypothetical protein HDU98_003233, partial [Podochytrium sp. JEL0797]
KTKDKPNMSDPSEHLIILPTMCKWDNPAQSESRLAAYIEDNNLAEEDALVHAGKF